MLNNSKIFFDEIRPDSAQLQLDWKKLQEMNKPGTPPPVSLEFNWLELLAHGLLELWEHAQNSSGNFCGNGCDNNGAGVTGSHCGGKCQGC